MTQDLNFTEKNINQLIINSESQFEDCTFSGINFSEYQLVSSLFFNCNFQNCNLSNQNMTNATFRNVKFESCNLIGINWCTLKRFEGCEFNNCKLNYSVFQGLKLKNIIITNSQAIEVDFSDADLTNSLLTNTALAGTNFSRSILINADFRSAKDFLFDLRTTKIKGLQLSMPEALNLLTALGAKIEF